MKEEELYQPPSADLTPDATPAAALYSPGQVAVATFLASPLAGCWLIASNFADMEQLDARRNMLVAGVVATLVVLMLALFLPEDFPNLVLPLAYTLGLRQLAVQMQGEAFDAHKEAGGQRHSHWRVAGVSAVAFIVFIVFTIAAIFLIPESMLPLD